MTQNKYLEAASALGARLCREALWSGEICNWMGDAVEHLESGWEVVNRACGPELYSGTSGIALFLARLFSSTQEEIFKKTAHGAINLALLQLDGADPAASFGFYSGLSGIAYAEVETGEACGTEAMMDRGLRLMEEICACEPSPEQSWDVISGSAGLVPVLLQLHGRYGKPFLLDAALRHGDLILQAAKRSQEGWTWKTTSDPEMKELTGLSHGAAGIAWALMELYGQCGEQRFLEGAQQALRYERRWFDPQQENWPDFRFPANSNPLSYAVAWCHGAPGIGLARLRCYQILKDSECLKEALAALRTTTKSLNWADDSGEGNYSLCHGNSGNAELLMAAADILDDADSLTTAQHIAASAFEKYERSGKPWPCGVLNGGETPNLLLGLAGIGYFYLRLYNRKIPSVLLVGPR